MSCFVDSYNVTVVAAGPNVVPQYVCGQASDALLGTVLLHPLGYHILSLVNACQCQRQRESLVDARLRDRVNESSPPSLIELVEMPSIHVLRGPGTGADEKRAICFYRVLEACETLGWNVDNYDVRFWKNKTLRLQTFETSATAYFAMIDSFWSLFFVL